MQTQKQDFRVRVVPRTLRFRQPAGTSRGVYRVRQVWYVLVSYQTDGRRAIGLGECAPLYDLSAEYTTDYEQILRRFCADLQARGGSIDTEALRNFPSIRFGLETALLSAEGSLRTGNIFNLFDTPFARGEEGIRINGLVWMGRKEEMLARMEQKLADGYSCVKLKIGAIDFEDELELIASLRRRFSRESVELRVDANGAFTPGEAPEVLERLARYDIHSIEQPIARGQLSALAQLCRTSPLPIALDEELIGRNSLAEKRALLAEVRPQYLVLKPSLHGGMAGCEEWIREADALGTPCWVTSALESNVGLNAIAQWAAAVGLPKAGLAQGLGTGLLFTENAEGTGLHISGERLWRGGERDAEAAREVEEFLGQWEDDDTSVTLHTSGSTGAPKRIEVRKELLTKSALRTCETLGLRQGRDVALLCMPARYIAGRMQLLRARLWNLPLWRVTPTARPLQGLRCAPDFAALTPHQVLASLQGSPRERRLLRGIRHLLIGGGSISEELAAAVKEFPGCVWSTYGMTETLSHVALRRLSGPEATDAYTPLEGTDIALDERGCLVLRSDVVDPRLLTAGAENDGWLHTNDLATILPDGSFRILGRWDNVVVSGGIKLQIERIEAALSALPVPFFLTSRPDAMLGQCLVMLYVGTLSPDELRTLCRTLAADTLHPYELPRHYLPVSHLPLTPTGKPDRPALHRLAAEPRRGGE